MSAIVPIILAIDPGKSGGFAWQVDNVTEARPMPETEGDAADLIASLGTSWPVEAYMELVGGFVRRNKDGQEEGQPGSAMFKFGDGVGFLRGVLRGLKIPLLRVPPQRWQASLGIGRRAGRETRDWKNVLKAEAQRRFPALKVTLKTADALLILDWALRTRRQESAKEIIFDPEKEPETTTPPADDLARFCCRSD